MFKFIAGVWVTFFTALAVADVGETYQAGTYDAWLPIIMFIFIVAPMLLGYLAGIEDA